MGKKLQNRISQVCYQHIVPHMDKYNAEPDIERCLPLMEPGIFASFAHQACCDVAALVLRCGDETASAALLDIESQPGDEEMLCNRLIEQIIFFGDALTRYASVFQRFCQMTGLAYKTAWSNGTSIGEWAVNTYGGLTGLFFGAVGGFLAGNAINREMQLESERLQNEFNAMLQTYDRAMSRLTQVAVQLLEHYRQSILDAMGDDHLLQ